jgi:hypothetical protein
LRGRSFYYKFLVIPLLGLVASGSLAGAAVADSAHAARGSLSVTGAAAPSRVGSSGPAWSPNHLVLAPDGGFENGPPPASLWTETTNSSCEWILDPTSIFGIPAHRGTYAFWAGGYCGGVPTSTSVSQQILIRASHPTLRLFANYYRVDADDAQVDTFYVRVGTTIVFSKPMNLANNTFPNWVLETVDLSAYGGQTVRLTIGARSQGNLTGNVLVDDVHFGH